MDFRNKRLSINEAKQVDMVNYLSALGYKPVKIRNNDYWYLSPLRDEETASFKINRSLNRWYDHGLGRGGNLIDFAVLYKGCTVGEILNSFHNDFSFQKPVFCSPQLGAAKPESKVKIISDQTLSSLGLIQYLKDRRVSVEIANLYCREIRYKLGDTMYYGIGFKNDFGGWEIRNPYFKTSSSPKGITTIKSRADKVVVFEGFMDFLSFYSNQQNSLNNSYNFLILNSLSFFKSARPFMEAHSSILLFLDRDKAGQNYSRYALSLSEKYYDESGLYKNHKDYNDWVINFGRPTMKIDANQKRNDKVSQTGKVEKKTNE